MSNLHPKTKDNPRLMQKELADGRLSLYLEYYLGYEKIPDETKEKGYRIKHKRKKESLSLYLYSKPNNTQERDKNKDVLGIAKSIRQKKEDSLKYKKLNVEDKNKAKVNFLDYCQNFVNEYANKDIRIVKYCVKYFKTFVEKEKGVDYILPVDITAKFLNRFKLFLEDNLNGETPYNYFTKMKRISKEAINEGYPIEQAVLDIKNKRNEGLKKDILSIKEIQKLVETELSNKEVKRAFLFSLNTGLRFCDIKALKWSNINDEQIIIKGQQKTGKPVYIDLNSNAKKLIGEKGKAGDLVFNLPSLTGALKLLKTWTKTAKIEKNITWHSARHSFAVNLLTLQTDIKTVSSLLGHSGLKHTEKYTRVVDELKKQAVNKLPEINL